MAKRVEPIMALARLENPRHQINKANKTHQRFYSPQIQPTQNPPTLSIPLIHTNDNPFIQPLRPMSIPPSSSTSQQFTYAASATPANGTYFPTPFHLQQSDPYPKPYAAPSPTVMPPVYPPAPIGPVYSLPQYQQVSNCIRIFRIWVFYLVVVD